MASSKQKDTRKILVLDIEWQPALAYVWRMWKQNIQPDMLIDHGGMLCFCAHWHGSKEFMFYSKWEHGREGMAQAALDLLTEADAVVTYNGDKFDLPKITGEILLAGLSPPPPVTSIDLLKAVKKFGFNMNRMAYIAPLLGVGGKLSHEGFTLWKKAMDGDEVAQRKMQRYCIQDVRITDKLYKKIKPFIRNHPYMGENKAECPVCHKNNTQRRGYRRTRCYKTQRHQCNNCGHWFESTRTKVS